jgi:malate permease and related proteins
VTATAIGALLIILAGAAARRAGLARPEDGGVLVRIVLYLALPCLVFLIVVRADLSLALMLVPVAGWAVHGALLATALAAGRLMRLDRPALGAVAVSAAVGNTGFFGLPLIAASGAGFSLAAAVMYDTFATGLITWTSTVAVASALGEGAPRVAARQLARLLLLPPNWALAAGLVVNGAGVHDLPAVVERPLEILGGAVLPLVMIYAGLMLEVAGLRAVWSHVSVVAVIKLVLGAVVGLGVSSALGLTGGTMHTVVLMAGMPTAMLSLVLGSRYRLRPDLIAGAVVVTTLLATATLPAIRSLLL